MVFFNKVTSKDLWLLDIAARGGKINLAQYIMNQMISTLKQKIAGAKKSPPQHIKVVVPYVNIIMMIACKMSCWNSRYELIKLRAQCNLGSISKIGYKKVNGQWVKTRGAHGDAYKDKQDEDNDSGAHEDEQAVEPQVLEPAVFVSTSLEDIIAVLGQIQLKMNQRFNSINDRFQEF